MVYSLPIDLPTNLPTFLSSRYQCYNRTHGSKLSPALSALWAELGGAADTCGCLHLPVEEPPKTCAFREAAPHAVGSRLPSKDCEKTVWVLLAGDSTMAPNGEVLQELLHSAKYRPVGWVKSSLPPDYASSRKHLVDQLRGSLSSSGRLGVTIGFEDDFLFKHESSGYQVLISNRQAKGMSLSKWDAVFAEPWNQFNNSRSFPRR